MPPRRRIATASPASLARLGLLLLTMVALAALGAWAFVQSGVYDVSATTPHWRPVYQLLEQTAHRSVQRHAQALRLDPELLAEPARRRLGAACFRQHCVQCHGAPGIAPEPFALGLQPVPGSLIAAGRRWRPEELYWLTRYGVKMSGMPAWEFRLGEDELLGLVAFIAGELPQLRPQQYRELDAELLASDEACGKTQPPLAGTRVEQRAPRAQGALALRQHGCTACHRIPGVNGPDADVGPPLDGFARRQLIAGRLPNSRENLVRWIRDPQSIDPRTAMPTLGVGEAGARQMADYLGRLD